MKRYAFFTLMFPLVFTILMLVQARPLSLPLFVLSCCYVAAAPALLIAFMDGILQYRSVSLRVACAVLIGSALPAVLLMHPNPLRSVQIAAFGAVAAMLCVTAFSALTRRAYLKRFEAALAGRVQPHRDIRDWLRVPAFLPRMPALIRVASRKRSTRQG